MLPLYCSDSKLATPVHITFNFSSLHKDVWTMETREQIQKPGSLMCIIAYYLGNSRTYYYLGTYANGLSLEACRNQWRLR